MNKRSFLKLTTAAIAGTALNNLAACSPNKSSNTELLTNWAGNLQYGSGNIYVPASLSELQGLIKGNTKVRVLGTRHCFNTIADTNATHISTSKLNKIVKIDPDNWTVTVESGIRYGEFCKQIHEAGFAIHNLASLPHISVAGACATATHGSGVKNGNLATNISSIEFINGKGELTNLSRQNNPDVFDGAIVNLGSIGLVTKMALDLIPAFNVRQDVYLNLPMSELDTNFVEIMSGGYSVSLFTDWQTKNINQVWRKSVALEGYNPPPEYFRATLAPKNVHPIIELSAENCTGQMGVPGPWFERLPHFKMGFTPSSGEELQAEYFIPIENAADAIKSVATLKEEIKPYILITEIRSIAADKLWMSPCYEQPSIAIHFTLRQDVEGVNNLLPKIEEKLRPFNPKPHWGKLFLFESKYLQSQYRRLDDFKKLVSEHDPDGKFRNEFIEKNLFG